MGLFLVTINYPDLAIGRFSASNAAEVTVQVNKTINYEQNPNQTFWDKGPSIASGESPGIASGEGPGDDNERDFERIDVIKENKLLPNQYSSITEIYTNGSSSQVSSAINSGAHVINYAGHGSQTNWGTTGFSNNNINSLSNGDKLPIIFSVACVNGAFP